MHALFFNIWKIWNPLWNNKDKWQGKYFHFIALLTFGIWQTATYLIVALICGYKGVSVWVPKLALDSQIPFLQESIFPYILIYYGLPFIFLFLANRSDQHKQEILLMIQSLVITSLIAYIVFLIFPTIADNYKLPTTTPFFTSIYSNIALSYPQYNCWPSLHVAHSFIYICILSRWTNRKILKGLFWSLFIIVSLTTLTTKQHFVWDVITGAVLGIVIWRYVLMQSLITYSIALDNLEKHTTPLSFKSD